jgi:enamine deaminase RidA (YjgF/YER057c/UK114 family)
MAEQYRGIRRMPIENGKSILTRLDLPGGGLLWCVASAPDVTADFDGQTHQVLASLASLLQEGGAERSRIVKAEIVVTDHDNKPRFDAIWREWVPKDCGPVRSFVQSRMPDGDLVEVILTVAV